MKLKSSFLNDEGFRFRVFGFTELPSILLIRFVVGFVFFSEGVQKFLYPDIRGAGRFEKIGLPEPEFLGYFVGSFEVLCGALVFLGLATRAAVIPLIIIMLVAISTTKIPILIESGFWKMAHDSRTDLSMLIGSVFLFLNGAGPISLDNRIIQRWRQRGV